MGEGKETFVLEEHYISDDDDEHINYDIISDGGDDDLGDGNVGLATLADIERSIQRKEEARVATEANGRAKVRCSVRPSLVDDFIRNFYIKMNLSRSLNAFNSEWYELQSKGKLSAEDVEVVPDIYLRNQELDEQVKTLRVEVDKMKVIAAKAQGTWDKFRKERDFHRMHHKRVTQEKSKLIVDIKRLKKHYTSYGPTLNELRRKYEIAMKEKMLMRLERDRLVAKCEALEAQMKSLEEAQNQGGALNVPARDSELRRGRDPRRGKTDNAAVPLPDGGTTNPFLNLVFEAAPVGNYQLSKTFKGHLNSVSSLAFHPKKHILATVSDDQTWKLWAVPNGELIMSGEGHKGWIADVDFHPNGSYLATGAGDSTVKVWDFVNASCSATFSDHTQAVWGCSWHHCGDFLVSCSMDHTSKLWDVKSQRCRQTFRGHVDSVNAVCFQPFSNNICTGSGDKTVSLWDIRSGLCIQTFYGHMNACNHVTFNLKGDTIASCDADGCVKLWDVRMVVERGQISGGQHPLNKVSFDRSGSIISAACDDGTIKLFDALQMEHTGDLRGHEDAVQAVQFDPFGKFLVSTGSDCTFRVWQ